MKYTILSARFAYGDNKSAELTTEEAGLVLISEKDTPELWLEMVDWGTPSDYVPPPTQTEPTKAELIAQLAALQAKIEALP